MVAKTITIDSIYYIYAITNAYSNASFSRVTAATESFIGLSNNGFKTA